eukprot:2785715-Amphidinium_carterae.1
MLDFAQSVQCLLRFVICASPDSERSNLMNNQGYNPGRNATLRAHNNFALPRSHKQALKRLKIP